MTDLAKAVLNFRAKYNLTQAELARMCKLNREVIIRAERSRNITRLSEAKIRLVLEEEKK